VSTVPPFRFPALACDTHCHVVGPRTRFPLTPARADDDTPDATQTMLATMHARLGIARAVIVQSGLHGTDSSVTLDAVAAGNGRRRGVVLLDPEAPDGELERLHAGGIRGIRFNMAARSDKPPAPDALVRLADRIAGLGWHFLLHLRADQLLSLSDLWPRLRIPLVFDHLARIDPAGGVEQPAVQRLLELLATGNRWVKIAAVDKLSHEPYPFGDVAVIGRTLVAAAPDRAIWGTDWPHPDRRGLRHGSIPDDAELAALIPSYAPDARFQQKLLVDNPTHLYGFA
jgi:2-pyrone-4,6-dicarboxylate lactonase